MRSASGDIVAANGAGSCPPLLTRQALDPGDCCPTTTDFGELDPHTALIGFPSPAKILAAPPKRATSNLHIRFTIGDLSTTRGTEGLIHNRHNGESHALWAIADAIAALEASY
jgi:hypothetical protein